MSSQHTLTGSAGSITRVAGIEVGHFTETRRPTGCTVILARDGTTRVFNSYNRKTTTP